MLSELLSKIDEKRWSRLYMDVLLLYEGLMPDTKRYVAFERLKGGPTVVWLTHPDVE